MPSSTISVAVVGAGPAGLYVADALTFQEQVAVRVDLFDRLPTPFGLLRYGVAPDHLKMKATAVGLQRTLDQDNVRFIGNVEVGRDISVEELREHYSAIVYTYGAATDRRLGIAGEDVRGSHSATEFVNWYSGHPDADAPGFDLAAVESAVVIGVGNVAVDIARMLIKDANEVAATDVPASVADAFRASRVTDVHILGRRGPLDAKFTLKELRELGELAGVDVIVDGRDFDVSPEVVDAAGPQHKRIYELMKGWAEREPTGAGRRLHMHFWTAPVEAVGESALSEVVVRRTRSGNGYAEGDVGRLEAQLMLRSVGYRGLGIGGVPFSEDAGTIPHDDYRVLRDGTISAGEYVAGWIARGPSGVLGTNRADADQVAERIVADRGVLADAKDDDIVELLRGRGRDVVDCAGWSGIDRAELDLGQRQGRARAKLSTWGDLLSAARG